METITIPTIELIRWIGAALVGILGLIAGVAGLLWWVFLDGRKGRSRVHKRIDEQHDIVCQKIDTLHDKVQKDHHELARRITAVWTYLQERNNLRPPKIRSKQ